MWATASYAESGGLPILEELLAVGPHELKRLSALNRSLANCSSITITSDGTTLGGTVGATSFPKVGDHSRAYAITFAYQGLSIDFDLVLFKAGR